MKCNLDFWKHKNVVYELVRKNVKTQYRNSFLGMLWTVLHPLLNMLIMWLVFSQFFGKGDPLYPIYLLAGNIMFQLLRSATDGALTSIVSNRGLLSRAKISPYLFPLSITLSSIVNFAFSFISLILIMLGMQIFGGYNLFGYQMLGVVLMLPAMVLFCYGIALFLSSMYVFFRDVKHLYGVFLTLWTYITPLFYKLDAINSNALVVKVVKLNPMYYFVTYFRDAVYNACFVGASFADWGMLGLLYGLGAISVVVGYGVYALTKKHFMMHV